MIIVYIIVLPIIMIRYVCHSSSIYQYWYLIDEYDGSMSHMLQMGLEPISPFSGALPWATAARVDMVLAGAVVVATAEEAIDIATTAAYVWGDGYGGDMLMDMWWIWWWIWLWIC